MAAHPTMIPTCNFLAPFGGSHLDTTAGDGADSDTPPPQPAAAKIRIKRGREATSRHPYYFSQPTEVFG
jgi:hypothetical protein